ncbi:MAG: Gldg family protein [Candidatus Sumerlaeia bacterium]|nr:Gldg family protein [Candidatus Sumerlaeia bacterium]
MTNRTTKRQASTVLRSVPVVLGLIGLVTMVVLGAVNGHFTTMHFAIGFLSITSMIGGLFWLQEVAWKQTVATIVYSVFFVFCATLVYLISANRNVRFDITRDQIHTISPLTRSMLNAIPPGHRVVAQIFAPASQHNQLARLLENCERESSRFVFELYDPDRDLDVVMQLGGTVRKGTIFVSHVNEEGELLARVDRGEFSLTNPLRESVLTNAIARTLQDENKKYYFVTGHGGKRLDGSDGSLTKLANLIVGSTFPIEGLRLAEGRIPDDVAALIIAGPARDLSAFERELLEHYLDEGGDLLLMLDPVMPGGEQLTNFEELIDVAGALQAPNLLVIDPSAVNISGYAFTPLGIWADHEISRATNQAPFSLVQSRPILANPNPPDDIEQYGIITTNNRAWVERLEDLRTLSRFTPPSDPDEIGVYTMAASTRRPTPGGRFGDEMRMVVVGDSEGFTDRHLERNGDAALFVLQSLNWMRGEQDLLQVPPRRLTSTPLNLTATTAWMLAGIYLGLGLLFTLGGTAWTVARRRSK